MKMTGVVSSGLKQTVLPLLSDDSSGLIIYCLPFSNHDVHGDFQFDVTQHCGAVSL